MHMHMPTVIMPCDVELKLQVGCLASKSSTLAPWVLVNPPRMSLHRMKGEMNLGAFQRDV